MMMKVFVFTPTWTAEDGSLAMRPECEASVVGQEYEGGIERVVGTHNPYPGRDHRNVLAQYQRAREMFLDSDCGAMLTVEHDMTLPAGGIGRLVAALERDDYGMRLHPGGRPGVAFGVYMLRHGSWVLNAWEFIGEHAMGESLTLYPGKLAAARRMGVVRVSGVGWGCTLMRREVVAGTRFGDGNGTNSAGDVAFAMDCLYRGVVMVAAMDVACDHYDDGLWLRPFGGGAVVEVEALQDVVVMGEKGSMRLETGGRYELGRRLADDLARTGYVRITNHELRIMNGEGGEAGNSAVGGRGDDEGGKDGDKEGKTAVGADLAAMTANERAVVGKGRRRKGVADAQ